MSDDDLIRDAVHELVGAAPAPKPLPAGGAPLGRSYRWLAVAAAVILLVGGIVAIASLRSGDDEPVSVATTAPPPVSTAHNTLPATSAPVTTLPTPAVPTSVPPDAATTTTTSTTTTSTTTTLTPTTTVALTPEAAVVVDYLSALADGRYADAALLLNEGGLEPERRSDLRPLFDEYGDIADLPARLQTWCEEEAICSGISGPPIDIGGYWVAEWNTPNGVVIGYFRSGSYEGSASVHGLPPRRATGAVVACPTSDVLAVREGDVDGDGEVETIVLTVAGPTPAVQTCNSSLAMPPAEQPAGTSRVDVLQPDSDPAVTLLVGTSDESSSCGTTQRFAQSAQALVAVGWDGCWGPNTGESIGCRDDGGESTIVAYRYTFLGGDRLDNSTGIDVDVLSLDGAPLDSFTLGLPDQIEEAFMIVEPHCNGLPVVTEG